ncbi:MAG TPA: hypothetical protein VE863_05475 [Pyrinomonadaceae bacterium]|jgi:hypothetical protein|nr:hypothetical protein [Pyrinomonadaceae bacterium]
MFRRINISATIIVLVCFFLPWEQVSCAGARDSLSGFDLARHDQTLLFLIPLLMLAVIVMGAVRRRREKATPLAIVSIIAGGVSGLLMNRQRVRVHDEAGLISAQLTGWFWVAFLSTLTLMVASVGMLMGRRHET